MKMVLHFLHYRVSQKVKEEKQLLRQIPKWSFQEKQLIVPEIITLHPTVDFIFECSWFVKYCKPTITEDS